MRKYGLPILWVVSVVSLLLSAIAVGLFLQSSAPLTIGSGEIFNFIGITIGAVALVATVGFLVLAFPIWGEMSAIAKERQEISLAREETERLQRSIKNTLDDINAPFSRYTELYQSLQLFSLVIRYIGETPVDAAADTSGETDSERIARHVSIVRHLMAAMAIDPERDPAAFLSLVRDAVGHLRKTDDETFFDFIEVRLNAVRPNSDTLKERKSAARTKFDIVRGEAAGLR